MYRVCCTIWLLVFPLLLFSQSKIAAIEMETPHVGTIYENQFVFYNANGYMISDSLLKKMMLLFEDSESYYRKANRQRILANMAGILLGPYIIYSILSVQSQKNLKRAIRAYNGHVAKEELKSIPRPNYLTDIF